MVISGVFVGATYPSQQIVVRHYSGDLVDFQLDIDSWNDYVYLIFADKKAAGFEPVDVRSGYTEGGVGTSAVFRDEDEAFFMRTSVRGKHSFSKRLLGTLGVVD